MWLLGLLACCLSVLLRLETLDVGCRALNYVFGNSDAGKQLGETSSVPLGSLCMVVEFSLMVFAFDIAISVVHWK